MNKLFIPFLLIIAFLTVGCSDDNNENEPITSFSLEKDYYEVRLERSATSISIINGSGDISLKIENESILNATYAGGLYADDLRGVISLHGKKKGNTMLTVHDNVTGDKETVEVKVTDCYLAYAISESNHPALKANTTLFFINNPAKDSYIFAIDKLHGKLYDQPIAKGSYEFFVTLDSGIGATPAYYAIPNLRLYNSADARTTTSKFYDFQIEMYGEDASSSYVLKSIQAYLGVDWEELISNALTKSPASIDMTMIMTVPNTDYKITGVLSATSIPEHILD